jgi:ribosome maturation factor RimP
MISKEIVKELVEERIEGTDIFIVEIDISSGNKILVTIDADSGVNIEKCMSVSRNVEHNLDREEEDFSLEVSSFSLSSPLVLPRQYKKYIGKMIEVITLEMKKITGKLLDFNENELSMEMDLTKKQIKSGAEAKIIISFNDIKETKAVISFKK